MGSSTMNIGAAYYSEVGIHLPNYTTS